MTGLLLLFALVGLALGSFGNVLIGRIRSGESFAGRSHCMSCLQTIAWFDLVPVCSFLFLGGHCRHCRSTISIRYPLVETGSMLLFVLALFLTPDDPLLAFFTALSLYCLFLACVYDGLYQQIPDLFTFLLFLAALLTIVFSGAPITAHLLGILPPLGWFGIQWIVSRGRAVGTGDIFLASVIGLWLGIRGALSMLIISYMIGALVVALLLMTRVLRKQHERIAFGPFLGVATLLTLLGAGDAYLSLLS